MPQRFFVAWAILLTLKPNIFILWLSVISVWTCDMLLLLLLSRFRCVRLCATPHGSPPESPGFSRQEHGSGLPSPMHESEK